LVLLLFWVFPGLESWLKPKPPEQEVEVTWIERVPEDPEIKLPPPPMPSPAEPEMVAAAPPLPRPTPPSLSPPPPPAPTPEPKKKEKIPELTILPKPPPPKLVPPPPKPPEPEPPPEPEKPKPDLRAQQMKKVEVDDEEHVVDKPPPEAAYLSDKNRRVQEETRDTKTNLDKLSKGKADASEKSDDKESEDIGGEDEKVRQLEKAEASSFEKKRLDPTVHSGKDQIAKGLQSGAKGEAATGEQGKEGDAGKPGALSMRDVEGKGAPASRVRRASRASAVPSSTSRCRTTSASSARTRCARRSRSRSARSRTGRAAGRRSSSACTRPSRTSPPRSSRETRRR
jgi:hypothetical protein